jgi:hypothetical protein
LHMFFFLSLFFFNGDDNFFEYVIHRDLFSDMSRVFLQVVFFLHNVFWFDKRVTPTMT